MKNELNEREMKVSPMGTRQRKAAQQKKIILNVFAKDRELLQFFILSA